MILIDCQTCPVREVHCADCMVAALTNTIPIGPPATPTGHPLDRSERRAVSLLLAAGLVSPESAHSARAILDDDVDVTARARSARAAVV